MAVYRNNYTKQEDFALWILHEIRYKMSSRKTFNAETINKSAKKLVSSSRMSRLKFLKKI